MITRRHLLKASAAAAGASALMHASCSRPGYPTVGPNERVHVGIIGCRGRGWQDAVTLQRSGQFDILAMCDCDTAMIDAGMKQFLERCDPPHRPRTEKDFRRLLDDPKLDAVAICTPDHWHALMTVMALEAGKHVFVEKPVSFDIAEGRAMVEAHRRYPKLAICVGTQQRSAPHFKQAKAFIAEGNLGKIGFARAWLSGTRCRVNRVSDTDPPPSLDYDMWCGPAPRRPYNHEKVHYNWRFMRDYGTNDAGNWGAHYLDIIRWYADLDLPTAVTGSGGKFIIKDEKEWFDTQTVFFEYPETTVVWEMRHWTSNGIEQRGTGAEIRGEKGTLIIDRDGWVFYPHDGSPQNHPATMDDIPHAINFARCVGGQDEPSACIVKGHKSAVLCHLANMATLLNRRIRFDPETESVQDDPEAARLTSRPYREKWNMPQLHQSLESTL